jgi:hypothetical protein
LSSPAASSGKDPTRSTSDAVLVALIGPVFLATALWFVFGRTPDDVPRAEPTLVSTADIIWPTRPLMTDPPTMQVAGFAKKCNDCHSLFTSDPDTPLRLNQHRNIVQAHGMNDRCFNCHDRLDRGMLALPGGETIPFTDTARVCATCHGTTYRDWQAGMHGRTIESWDRWRPEHARLTCTECHDPHAPAFEPMLALPGPDTLRMGDQHEPVHDSEAKRNPLRQWSGGRHGGTEARGHEGGRD